MQHLSVIACRGTIMNALNCYYAYCLFNGNEEKTALFSLFMGQNMKDQNI